MPDRRSLGEGFNGMKVVCVGLFTGPLGTEAVEGGWEEREAGREGGKEGGRV